MEIDTLLSILKFFLSNPDDLTWMTRFVLFAWLSNLILIPFDITKLSFNSSITETESIDKIMYSLCVAELDSNGKSVESASLCLARIIIRRDCTDYFSKFLHHTATIINESTNNILV